MIFLLRIRISLYSAVPFSVSFRERFTNEFFFPFSFVSTDSEQHSKGEKKWHSSVMARFFASTRPHYRAATSLEKGENFLEQTRVELILSMKNRNFTTMRFLMLLTLSRRTSKFWFNSIMQNILVCRRFKCPSSLKMALQSPEDSESEIPHQPLNLFSWLDNNEPTTVEWERKSLIVIIM